MDRAFVAPEAPAPLEVAEVWVMVPASWRFYRRCRLCLDKLGLSLRPIVSVKELKKNDDGASKQLAQAARAARTGKNEAGSVMGSARSAEENQDGDGEDVLSTEAILLPTTSVKDVVMARAVVEMEARKELLVSMLKNKHMRHLKALLNGKDETKLRLALAAAHTLRPFGRPPLASDWKGAAPETAEDASSVAPDSARDADAAARAAAVEAAKVEAEQIARLLPGGTKAMLGMNRGVIPPIEPVAAPHKYLLGLRIRGGLALPAHTRKRPTLQDTPFDRPLTAPKPTFVVFSFPDKSLPSMVSTRLQGFLGYSRACGHFSTSIARALTSKDAGRTEAAVEALEEDMEFDAPQKPMVSRQPRASRALLSLKKEGEASCGHTDSTSCSHCSSDSCDSTGTTTLSSGSFLAVPPPRMLRMPRLSSVDGGDVFWDLPFGIDVGPPWPVVAKIKKSCPGLPYGGTHSPGMLREEARPEYPVQDQEDGAWRQHPLQPHCLDQEDIPPACPTSGDEGPASERKTNKISPPTVALSTDVKLPKLPDDDTLAVALSAEEAVVACELPIMVPRPGIRGQWVQGPPDFTRIIKPFHDDTEPGETPLPPTWTSMGSGCSRSSSCSSTAGDNKGPSKRVLSERAAMDLPLYFEEPVQPPATPRPAHIIPAIANGAGTAKSLELTVSFERLSAFWHPIGSGGPDDCPIWEQEENDGSSAPEPGLHRPMPLEKALPVPRPLVGLRRDPEPPQFPVVCPPPECTPEAMFKSAPEALEVQLSVLRRETPAFFKLPLAAGPAAEEEKSGDEMQIENAMPPPTPSPAIWPTSSDHQSPYYLLHPLSPRFPEPMALERRPFEPPVMDAMVSMPRLRFEAQAADEPVPPASFRRMVKEEDEPDAAWGLAYI
eukprot:TRINITY_DN4436_c0_g1_i8.p1 TRINITY_DN4436_c0_g1~~TRINITY_DN4436_c0_g1_i8.p1  ORF type:complete len:890 (+),score=178.06 TRINITY_DN4436_c0_g1_i8:174-2843(+)